MRTKLPSITTLRISVDPVYELIMDNIRQKIGDDDIYMMIDESTD